MRRRRGRCSLARRISRPFLIHGTFVLQNSRFGSLAMARGERVVAHVRGRTRPSCRLIRDRMPRTPKQDVCRPSNIPDLGSICWQSRRLRHCRWADIRESMENGTFPSNSAENSAETKSRRPAGPKTAQGPLDVRFSCDSSIFGLLELVASKLSLQFPAGFGFGKLGAPKTICRGDFLDYSDVPATVYSKTRVFGMK